MVVPMITLNDSHKLLNIKRLNTVDPYRYLLQIKENSSNNDQ